jgi:LuxR family quorum sensing-dependent transcriptional regulator
MALSLDKPLELYVFDQIERGDQAASEAELCAIFAGAFEHFGFDHFLVSEAVGPDGRPSGIHQFGTSHAAWRAHYEERGHVRRDAMIPRVLTTFDPFTWTETMERPIDDAGEVVLNEAREFSLRDGFVLPLHYMDGSASGVLLMADHVAPIEGRRRAALQILSYYFATIGRRLQMAARLPAPGIAAAPVMLTPRQRDCLQWVRAGKTDWEIGMILGISEHTVAEHLDVARKKLGARTRTQAVIEAIALKLIFL